MDAAAGGNSGPERDPRAAAREARAERYFEHDLAGQRRWYGERASHFKARAQTLGITVVAAGAATSFLQVFRGSSWVPVLTALLGAVVALAEGWRQIARYDEAWAAYRLASERMKRERRLYVNGAGEYRPRRRGGGVPALRRSGGGDRGRGAAHLLAEARRPHRERRPVLVRALLAIDGWPRRSGH